MAQKTMQAITPNLWFDHAAEEAVNFYVGIFPDSSIRDVTYYPTEGLLDFQQELAGKVLTIDFTLRGQKFTAINAGPDFTFTEAVSFVITCGDQSEIDYYWDALSAVPGSEQCGRLKDKYGLSWQVVPQDMGALMKRPGAFPKLLAMKKLVIADF